MMSDKHIHTTTALMQYIFPVLFATIITTWLCLIPYKQYINQYKIYKYQQKWGKKLYSQNNEELFIRDYFQDKKNGIFVDVGANHYKRSSTTFYLEKHLNWRGIAIDAIASFEKGYRHHRKNTLFFNYYISNKSDQYRNFFLVDKVTGRSSAYPTAVAGFEKRKIKVPSITLTKLLKQVDIHHFDFLSMDIELAEPEALEGFDIDYFKPQLVCIEGHAPVREKIFAYFKNHDYRLVEEYTHLDPVNYYFIPNEANILTNHPQPTSMPSVND